MDTIFDNINMSKLRYIGSGSSNICLTDGVYAIKIGLVCEYEAEKMIEAYQHGLSIPVIAFQEHVKIPQAILDILKNYDNFYCEGMKVYPNVFDYILTNKYANVMITPLIKPYMKHEYNYTPNYRKRAYKIAKKLAAIYTNMTGNDWEDSHPWNMGKYNGNLVILDF